MQSTEFPLAPYSISLFYIIAVVVGLMLAGLFTLFFTVGYGFNHITTNVGPDGLEFKGIFYGEKFPKSKLKVGEARPVDLDDRKKAVIVPTTEGYPVLVSPNDPAAFLAALKR